MNKSMMSWQPCLRFIVNFYSAMSCAAALCSISSMKNAFRFLMLFSFQNWKWWKMNRTLNVSRMVAIGSSVRVLISQRIISILPSSPSVRRGGDVWRFCHSTLNAIKSTLSQHKTVLNLYYLIIFLRMEKFLIKRRTQKTYVDEHDMWHFIRSHLCPLNVFLCARASIFGANASGSTCDVICASKLILK